TDAFPLCARAVETGMRLKTATVAASNALLTNASRFCADTVFVRITDVCEGLYTSSEELKVRNAIRDDFGRISGFCCNRSSPAHRVWSRIGIVGGRGDKGQPPWAFRGCPLAPSAPNHSYPRR